MKAITKIKLKIFLIKCIFELIVNGAILSFAFLSGMVLETLMFYISWQVFRTCVPKMFHIRSSNPLVSIIGCLFCSILTFMFAIKLMLPLSVSIFSSVIVGMIINYALYKAQDYIDIKKQLKKRVENIYAMDEEKLRNYAKSKHLSEMMIDTLVLKVIHNYKWIEIQKERNYSKSAIRYHKQKICKILDIEL